MNDVETSKRKHLVHGQMMDRKNVAKVVHVSVKKLNAYMGNHRCSLEQAHDYFKTNEPERTQKAVAKVMEILASAYGC